MLKSFLKNKQNQAEIFRFVIVGVICTIVDFVVSVLVQYVIYKNDTPIIFLGFNVTPNILVAAIAGYIFGVITNYILSIVVVFKNVSNEKKPKSVKGFVLFFALSTGGFLINYAIKELGNSIINMDENILWFAYVFGVATFVVLIYNYITRKVFIFKGENKQNQTE